MKISASTLNKKINSFLAQLNADDLHVILYPSDMELERVKNIATTKGWKGSHKDMFFACHSLSEVVVRRLA